MPLDSASNFLWGKEDKTVFLYFFSSFCRPLLLSGLQIAVAAVAAVVVRVVMSLLVSFPVFFRTSFYSSMVRVSKTMERLQRHRLSIALSSLSSG